MRTEYNVTYEDFLDSMRSYRKVARGAAFVYYLDVWVLPILGVCFALYWLSLFQQGYKEAADDLLWPAVVGILLAAVLPLAYWAKLRKSYRQRISLTDRGLVVLTFDDAGICLLLPGMVNTNYSWTAITRFIQTDKTVTLFMQKAGFHTVPKRAMDEAGWNEFRAVAQQHGVKS